MTEIIVLQFDQDMTLENSVVEDKIDKEMFTADEQPFPSGLETKTASQFEQRFLQFVEYSIFDCDIRAIGVTLQSSKKKTNARNQSKISNFRKYQTKSTTSPPFFNLTSDFFMFFLLWKSCETVCP